MKNTILNGSQFKIITKKVGTETFKVKIRFDDECGNGHNSFAITVDSFVRNRLIASGTQTGIIKKHFPELNKYTQWHLCDTDSPFHYIENTLYHVENNELSFARSSAIWPNAEMEEITKANLERRLPELMVRFQLDMEELGFIY